MVSARGPGTPLLEMCHAEVTAPRAVLCASSVRPLPAARRACRSPSPSWSSGTRSIWRTSEWLLEMGMRVPFGMRVAVLDAWRGRLAKQPGKRLGQATPAFSATAPSRTQPGRPRRVTGQPAGPRHRGHCSARQRFKLWGRTTSWTSPRRTVWSGGICRTFAKTESRRRTAAA